MRLKNKLLFLDKAITAWVVINEWERLYLTFLG